MSATEDQLENQRRASKTYGRQRKVGLFGLHELPGLLLCECLAGAVAVLLRVLDGVFFGDGIPVLFGICMAWTTSFLGIVNCCKGAGNHLDTFRLCVVFRQDRRHATRFTVGADFFTALSKPVVPMIAGSRKSFLTSLTFS